MPPSPPSLRPSAPASWRAVPALLALSLIGLVAVSLPAAGAPPARPVVAVLDPALPTSGTARVVVSGVAGAAGSVAAAVRAAGGRVRAALPLVDGAAADLPAAGLPGLAADPSVRAVTLDRAARVTSLTGAETGTASTFVRTTGATSAWSAGHRGAGVGVAVLDTGVSPMPDLAGRVVHGPDLSGEGRTVDTYGHGTVMAGLVGGNGADSVGRAGGAYLGVAPQAHVVSVKLAGANGVADVSTVLQAMHWVAAYREQYAIRVLTLAWGVPSTQDPSVDPLNYAVQRLWGLGITVVVAAGNDGDRPGSVLKPGDDPLVLTVGAYDDKGNADPADDKVPSWSGRGPTRQGSTKPDVVAPGRLVIAQRSYGSTIERDHPKALHAPSYIRGSGTSQASAIAAGAVALLLAARPELTPDQVKSLLRRTADPMPLPDANTQGAGRLKLGAALTADAGPAVQQAATATGLGSLDASRGGRRVQAWCDGVQTLIEGEQDVRCQPWDPAVWSGASWQGDAWTGASWQGGTWTGASWQGASWQGASWQGASWQGGAWTGASWQGASWQGASWQGASWQGGAWTGASWQGASWQGASWQGASWQGDGWSIAEYDDTSFQTAFWGGKPKWDQQVAGETSEQLDDGGLCHGKGCRR